MKELLLIAIGSALVNNVVLSQFLGLCPFLGVSKKVETSAGMGAAVIFVITIASAVTSLVYTGILVKDVYKRQDVWAAAHAVSLENAFTATIRSTKQWKR